MEMLLMGICISLFGMAVTAAAFSAATRPETPPAPQSEPVREPPVAVLPAGNFFVDRNTAPAPMAARVPIEALLLQLESHVRLEQAAAESFVAAPAASLLHTRTMSPLVN
jgi:hypothetical protein